MKSLIIILLLIVTTPVFAQYKITDYTRDTNMSDDDIVSGANSPASSPTNSAYTLGALKTYINAGVSTVTNWSDLEGLKAAVNWASEPAYLSSNAINWQGLEQLQRADINWLSVNMYTNGTNVGIGTSVLNSLLTIDQNSTTTSTRKGLTLTTNASTLLDNSAYTGVDESWDNLWEAIKFTPTQTGTGLYSQVCARLKIAATQTTFDKQFGIRLYTDSAGSPGSAVTNSSEAFPKFGVISTSYAEVCQALSSSVTLTSGTAYWLVLRKYSEPSQTVSMDSIASGTNTHAYSADGTTWTTESNKDGYVKLYAASPNTITSIINQGLGVPITATNYMTTAITASTTYGAQVYNATLGSNGQAYLGFANYGTGANMNSNYGTGYAANVLSGRSAIFTQTGSLTFDTYAPNVQISRTNTLGAFAHRGPMLRIEDTTASTGDALRIVKQNIPKVIVNSTGNTTLGGNLTVADTTSLGSEKVTNGTFTGSAASWTVGAGWAYNSNNVYHSTGSTADLSQAVSAVVGETYLVSLAISNNTNVNASLEGKLTVTLGGTAALPWADNSGASTYFPTSAINYIITAQTTGDLILTPDTNFNGIVDTVSVKKITSGNLIAQGNVGIGTGIPGQSLDVVGNTRIRGTGAAYFGNDNNTFAVASATSGGGLNFWSQGNNKFNISPNAAVAANFASGNVGIGTAIPEGALVIRSTTSSIGWTPVNAANQACNTTCVSGCVFGIDTSAVGNILACTDATADSCLCAGSN